MRFTLTGNAVLSVRRRERTVRAKYGMEKEWEALTLTPPGPTCGLLEAGALGCSPPRAKAA
jgi:hypothetical protein